MAPILVTSVLLVGLVDEVMFAIIVKYWQDPFPDAEFTNPVYFADVPEAIASTSASHSLSREYICTASRLSSSKQSCRAKRGLVARSRKTCYTYAGRYSSRTLARKGTMGRPWW